MTSRQTTRLALPATIEDACSLRGLHGGWRRRRRRRPRPRPPATRRRRPVTAPGRRGAATGATRRSGSSPTSSATRSSSRSSTAPSSPPRISASSSRSSGPAGRRRRRPARRSSQSARRMPASTGIATSVPGESLAEPLNDIIDGGSPGRPVQPARARASNAPYVGERSVGVRPHPRPPGRSSCSAAQTATGKVIIGNCFPGFPVLENRARRRAGGARRRRPASRSSGPSTSPSIRRRQLRRLGGAARRQPRRRGLDRPVRARPGQPRPAPGGQPRHATSSSAGYDLTAENLAAIKDGYADVSLGQTPFMQGYLPVKMLVDALAR